MSHLSPRPFVHSLDCLGVHVSNFLSAISASAWGLKLVPDWDGWRDRNRERMATPRDLDLIRRLVR